MYIKEQGNRRRYSSSQEDIENGKSLPKPNGNRYFIVFLTAYTNGIELFFYMKENYKEA